MLEVIIIQSEVIKMTSAVAFLLAMFTALFVCSSFAKSDQTLRLPREWGIAERVDKTDSYRMTSKLTHLGRIAKAEGVDIVAEGVRLSASSEENCARGASIDVEPKEGCKAPPRLLNDGLYVYHFEFQGKLASLRIRIKFANPKQICKMGIQMTSHTKIQKARLVFRDEQKIHSAIEVVFQDTIERQFVVFPPTTTSILDIEPFEFYYHYLPDFLSISEIELYEAVKLGNIGFFETDDIFVPRISRWRKFEPDCAGREVEWLYSVNSGASWKRVASDGNLLRALREDIKPYRIRFKAVLKRKDGESPIVRGFSLQFDVDPFKPIGKEITDADVLSMKDGMFINRAGKPIGLIGTSFDIHSNLWNWWATNWDEFFEHQMKPMTELVALYGMNVVRLAYAAPFFMPKPKVRPDDPEFEKAFLEFERMAREVWKKEPQLKYGKCGEEYLRFIDRTIEQCRRNGIYVILDLHQWPDSKEWAWGWWPDVSIDEILDGLVELWRLLARRYRNEDALLGFDIPFNEPTQDWAMDDEKYRSIVERIIKVLKTEAPEKLIFMEPQDWGHHCDVADVHPISLWDFPEGVDAVYPHYYLGIHYPHTDKKEAYRGWLANWLSWFLKPTIIGEWGPFFEYVVASWAGEPKFEPGFDPEFPNGRSRCIDAHLSFFYAQGVQLTNQWAWYGDPWAVDGSDTVFKFIHFWREHPPIPFERAKVKVALVCNPRYRANYGQSTDLQILVNELLDCHICPFKTLFEAHITQRPSILKQFDALIVYTKGMKQEALNILRNSGVPTMFVDEVRKNEHSGIAKFLKANRIKFDDKSSPELLIGYGLGGFVVFERYGKSGEFKVHPMIEAKGKILVCDYETKEVLAKGSAEEVYKKGFKVRIERNRAKVFEVKSLR